MRLGQNGYTVKRPTFTGEGVTEIIFAAEGPAQILYALLAGTGLLVGEAMVLEVQDICGTTIMVQSEKTANHQRRVEMHSSLAALLRRYIADRNSDFLFRNANGKPMWQIGAMSRSFHRILAAKGLERCGFHGFRRFRATHLVQNGVPVDLVRFWFGHAGESIWDWQIKLKEDVAFRTEWAEKVGLGFELPSVPGM